MANPPSLMTFRSLVHEERTLPDGWVDDTTVEDWQALLDAIAGRGWPVRAADRRPLGPFTARELFAADDVVTVSVWLEPAVQVNLFPSSPARILFDFDTGEIRGQHELAALCAFVELLGRVVGRRVSVAHEGAFEQVFLAYDPTADEYTLVDPVRP